MNWLIGIHVHGSEPQGGVEIHIFLGRGIKVELLGGGFTK